MKTGYDDMSLDTFYKKHIIPQFKNSTEPDIALYITKCNNLLKNGYSRFMVVGAVERYVEYLYHGEYRYKDVLDF